jgi:hypothetical protein
LLPCAGDAYVMDGTYRRESVSLCFYFWRRILTLLDAVL